MNDRKKYPRVAALAVAEELKAILTPACQRIAIAGSLRRGRHEVGDVELLFIPNHAESPDGLFDKKKVDLCAELCEKLLESGVLAKRPNVNGQHAWGDKNKLAVHCATGIPVDLFSTSLENWFVALVIRTGSKESNLNLTHGAMAQGGSLRAYGSGVTWNDGTHTPAVSEEHVFELCGVAYRTPERR